MAVLGGTQIISSQVGGGSGGAGRSGALPEFGNYTLYISGGTTYARNNLTGAIDSSNADAAVVINAAIANMPNGGTIFFKNGVYNLNSLIANGAGGLPDYYAIGIPSGGPTQYASWNLVGESMPPAIDLFGGVVQTNGVVLYVTATAIASVTAGKVIFNIWSLPDAANGIGATVSFRNLNVRFPTNQRGNETGINSTAALMADYDYVIADFAIAWDSLAFPVAGTHGLFGITSTTSIKEENYMKNTYAAGYDVGLDIQSEHTILVNSYAVDCNHGIDYGVRGAAIYHTSTWICSGWGECARGLTLGANCQAGSQLNIIGLDMEDATASVLPAFLPIYHAKETTAGNTNGLISFGLTTAGVGEVAIPPYLFDGGGGTNFMIASGAGWTSNSPLTVTGATTSGISGIVVPLASDNMTRADENPISDSGNWSAQTGTDAVQIVSNAAEAVTTSQLSFVYWNAFTWSNDQYSELTIGVLSGANFLIPAVRMATGAVTGYFLEVEGTGTLSIHKYVAGVDTSLANVSGLTYNAGDVLRIQAIGSLITAYHNGVLTLSATDASITSGAAGFGIYAATLVDATTTLWAGGTFRALTFGATTATSASAGGNGDVPSQVVGYLNWNLNGTPIKVPYYAA